MFNREFCKKILGVRFIECVLLIERLPFFVIVVYKLKEILKFSAFFNIKNDEMVEKRLQKLNSFYK